MKKNEMSRRRFLAATASVAMAAPSLGSRAKGDATATQSQDASSVDRIIGANERIRIGFIGSGNRANGQYVSTLKKLRNDVDHEIVALADPWTVALDRTSVLIQEVYGKKPRRFGTYRDLLEMKDLDAVMISSPDHHHTTHLEAAAKAGKHVYCEKPMGNELKKVLRAYDAAKDCGTVIQMGTQLRSIPGSVGARDFFKTGSLGHISRIEEIRNGEKPYWYKHLKDAPNVKPGDLDWKEFLGDTPKQPFNAAKYAAWYGYYEFSQGPVPQWAVHYIDLIHFITGCGFPESCVCHGGIFTWKDKNQFTAPDQIQALWVYPEGFMLDYSTNFGNGYGNDRKIYGDKGILKLGQWNHPVYTAEGGPLRDGSIRGENEVEQPENQPNHWLNWLQCIRDGNIHTMAPPKAGLQHAVASIMAMRSFESGKRTRWDGKRRKIVFG